MKHKFSNWFPPEVKPVRKGLYECEVCGNGTKHFWNGRSWKQLPISERNLYPVFQWRGLARKPK